jgi:hypothetical protein
MDVTIDAARLIEQVFALLADMPNDLHWLPPSDPYATTQVSETPIRLGATYRDWSQQGSLHGRV